MFPVGEKCQKKRELGPVGIAVVESIGTMSVSIHSRETELPGQIYLEFQETKLLLKMSMTTSITY